MYPVLYVSTMFDGLTKVRSVGKCIVPPLRRGNAARDALASRNAGALQDEFPRRSVGTM